MYRRDLHVRVERTRRLRRNLHTRWEHQPPCPGKLSVSAPAFYMRAANTAAGTTHHGLALFDVLLPEQELAVEVREVDSVQVE